MYACVVNFLPVWYFPLWYSITQMHKKYMYTSASLHTKEILRFRDFILRAALNCVGYPVLCVLIAQPPLNWKTRRCPQRHTPTFPPSSAGKEGTPQTRWETHQMDMRRRNDSFLPITLAKCIIFPDVHGHELGTCQKRIWNLSRPPSTSTDFF